MHQLLSKARVGKTAHTKVAMHQPTWTRHTIIPVSHTHAKHHTRQLFGNTRQRTPGTEQTRWQTSSGPQVACCIQDHCACSDLRKNISGNRACARPCCLSSSIKFNRHAGSSNEIWLPSILRQPSHPSPRSVASHGTSSHRTMRTARCSVYSQVRLPVWNIG